MKRFAAILLVFACLATQVRGQEDSLLSQLSHAKEDTFKTKLLHRIMQQYMAADPQAAMRYAQMGLEHARKMKWKKGMAAFHISIGNILSSWASYDTATVHYRQSYTINKEIGNQK